ncbi:hypothetical protein HMPREF3038_01586 [Akkermansia sp. KLE1797]|nr:hypothetical protein HMPREF3038_01586 [Akkermansia sp. KLE1797]
MMAEPFTAQNAGEACFWKNFLPSLPEKLPRPERGSSIIFLKIKRSRPLSACRTPGGMA